MEQGQTHNSASQLEPAAESNECWTDPSIDYSPPQLIFDQRRLAGDLNSVIVLRGVLKEAIIGIEEFSGQQEEQLARRAAVVQSTSRILNWFKPNFLFHASPIFHWFKPHF